MNKIRQMRISNDYKDMLKIQNQPYVSWVATKGEAPFVEEYELTIKVRTYCKTDNKIKTIDKCVVRVSLPRNYPLSAPEVKMISSPLVFHPHWFAGGSYCPGIYNESESLLNFVKRMIMTLQNEPSLVNPDSPANYDALEWYQANKHDKSLFPSDKTPLLETLQGFVIRKKTV